MNNYNNEQLFPNQEVYQEQVGFPVDAQKALDSLELSLLAATENEQIVAKKVLQNWSETLWQGMIYITNSLQEPNKSQFRTEFTEKLAIFIAHPDHGMTHSYFVYLGMHHLIDIDQNEITETQDQQLQLLALLHDAMQMLPFSMPEKTTGKLAQSNQKDEHARIIAALTRLYGQQLGFNSKDIRELSFGLREHDSSYNGGEADKEFNYVSALLHDADKLFGASYKTDTESLLSGMLERNFEANRGQKGANLVRTELDADFRKKVTYGDRCYTDSLAVIFRELELPMYTQAGQKIASERRKQALESMHKVYGEIFDRTKIILSEIAIPAIENQSNLVIFNETAMGHEPKIIKLDSKKELLNKIDELYNKVLVLPKKYQRNGYEITDIKGWKLQIIENGVTQHDIDPSIARFCIQENGKQAFLDELTSAFYQQFPTDNTTENDLPILEA